MIKLSAAILLAGLACGIASTATAQTNDDVLEGPDCAALTLSRDGKFDCIADGEPTPGKYYFTTWENNGKTIVRGYPVLVGMNYARVDQPTDFRTCQDVVEMVWNDPDFEKYDEIWCVKAGE